MDKIEYKAIVAEFKAADEGMFEGYAAFYGNRDGGGDKIMYGAFAKSIMQDRPNIKLMWNHDWDDVPIGTIEEIEEKPNGLYVKCKLNNTSKAMDVAEAIKTGAVTKMSIGYKCMLKEDQEENGEYTRIIKEAKLYEVSPVNFPMNEMASITGYKAIQTEGLKEIVKEALLELKKEEQAEQEKKNNEEVLKKLDNILKKTK